MSQVESKVAEKLLSIKAVKVQPKNPFTWASGWKSHDNPSESGKVFDREACRGAYRLCELHERKDRLQHGSVHASAGGSLQ